MFAPPPFRMTDEADAVALVEARRFATLVATGPQGPVAAYAPMLVERDAGGRVVGLVGHVARANPMAALAADGAQALAIFHGPEAYVSPGFYPSKAEHGKVVPTWNYMAVEVSGALEAITAPDALRALVGQLSDVMEEGRPSPWSVDDAPDDYVAMMSKAITGVRLHVDQIAGKAKLSQNRNAADRAGVVTGLSADPSHAAQTMARLVQSQET